ncbi:hypothetical protein HanRHA438_Chr15g0710511 [Helianthus annuus]|uniref:Uncharacterized protein n=1 Tax=Helianthus annuus TaxID=4232 RepID=A0A251TUJ0_HELAN|nr:hypothetical protein HanXRQr2_Chr15g0698321 [Helianthus annuus]KAJ0451583.1 hypothetical protein HanHA300_Chr15g0569191 [Helianthus annuus]KAJ0456143.1 hypothetical protein HanIR_Chr15g0759081 [Helianthus annuus]KAJ0473460.1 hypothetical protein HanHA89_Chr15g0618571 [Helianthus annuus]KAJ0649044.1 hypothetical protein HanLR1_Chr15g0579721 [Helianthus annuus]
MVARQQADDWILKLDMVARQQADDWIFKKDKDWMMQLLAVTLSLVSKMEETKVPHILDLKVCE